MLHLPGQTAEMLGDDCLMAAVASMVPLLNIYCFLTVRGRVSLTDRSDIPVWAENKYPMGAIRATCNIRNWIYPLSALYSNYKVALN